MCYTQKTNFCCGQKTNFSSATHTLPSITWHCTIPNVFQSQSENQWTFNSWAQVDRSGTFLFGICFRHELFVCPRISYDLMLEIRCENLCFWGKRWRRWTGQNQVTDSLTVSLPSWVINSCKNNKTLSGVLITLIVLFWARRRRKKILITLERFFRLTIENYTYSH